MSLAIKEAKKALNKNFVPIGCVIVKDNKTIARAYNKEFWHAEILCINKALKKLKNLSKCTIYVTIEPCPMCLYAIKLAKISTIIYGATNTKIINHKIYTIDYKKKECKELLQNFFKNKRNGN